MTPGSVPRRRPQPDLRASAGPSARPSDTREAASRGRVERPAAPAPGGLAGGWEGSHFPPRPTPRDPRILPCRARLLETSLCFPLSIPQGPKARGVTVPREKRRHPPLPGPTRHHVNAPRPSPRALSPAGGAPRRSRGSQRARRAARPTSPPAPPRARGAGFAQVCGAMPSAEPDARAARAGRVIDRPNYRLRSPRAAGADWLLADILKPGCSALGSQGAAGGGALPTSPKVISNLKWTSFQLLGASLPLFMVGGKLPPRRRF